MRSAAALRGFSSALSRRRLLPPPSCVGVVDVHCRWPAVAAAADVHEALTSNVFSAASDRWFSSSSPPDNKDDESSSKAEEVIGETEVSKRLHVHVARGKRAKDRGSGIGSGVTEVLFRWFFRLPT